MRRRLLRILLNAATVMSLVLCVATVGLWVWSYFQSPMVLQENSYEFVTVSRGRFFVYVERIAASPSKVPTRWRWDTAPTLWDTDDLKGLFPSDQCTSLAGFFVAHYADVHRNRMMILLPMWFVVTVLAALPIASALRTGRRSRHPTRGAHCVICDYDCRATPERCPECGTALVTTATPAREGKGETEGV